MGTVEWLDLASGAEMWAEAVERAVAKGRADRQTVVGAIEAGGFDSKQFAEKICRLYDKCVND